MKHLIKWSLCAMILLGGTTLMQAQSVNADGTVAGEEAPSSPAEVVDDSVIPADFSTAPEPEAVRRAVDPTSGVHADGTPILVDVDGTGPVPPAATVREVPVVDARERNADGTPVDALGVGLPQDEEPAAPVVNEPAMDTPATTEKVDADGNPDTE